MGHRTREQAARLEEKLAKEGYKKYNSCLTSSEDYAYFKAIGKDDEQFIDNIRKVTSQYRESYRKAAMLQKLPEFSLTAKKDAYKS